MGLAERQAGATLVCTLLLVCCSSIVSSRSIEKRDVSADALLQDKVKRPFCNAFTGCGRKRSDGALEMALRAALADSDGADVAPLLVAAPADASGGADLTAARANQRFYDDLLARLQALREQQQMLPTYLRTRRSLPASAAVSGPDSAGAEPNSPHKQEPKAVAKR